MRGQQGVQERPGRLAAGRSGPPGGPTSSSTSRAAIRARAAGARPSSRSPSAIAAWNRTRTSGSSASAIRGRRPGRGGGRRVCAAPRARRGWRRPGPGPRSRHPGPRGRRASRGRAGRPSGVDPASASFRSAGIASLSCRSTSSRWAVSRRQPLAWPRRATSSAVDALPRGGRRGELHVLVRRSARSVPGCSSGGNRSIFRRSSGTNCGMLDHLAVEVDDVERPVGAGRQVDGPERGVGRGQELAVRLAAAGQEGRAGRSSKTRRWTRFVSDSQTKALPR